MTAISRCYSNSVCDIDLAEGLDLDVLLDSNITEAILRDETNITKKEDSVQLACNFDLKNDCDIDRFLASLEE